MKQIKHGFKDYYYLCENGDLYNIKTNKYLKQDRHNYKLSLNNGEQISISLKALYKLVYNKNFCVDQIDLLEGEEFRPIKNTNDLYQISNYGRIKSLIGYEAIILKQNITPKGYNRIQLIQEKNTVNKFVHTLVAETFLDPPESLDYQIHHKDFDSLNNRSENLEYLTPQQHRKKHLERSY